MTRSSNYYEVTIDIEHLDIGDGVAELVHVEQHVLATVRGEAAAAAYVDRWIAQRGLRIVAAFTGKSWWSYHVLPGALAAS